MIDSLGRPDWDSFFMGWCFWISEKSIDPNTKHGCVAVSSSNIPLAVGYNGPPRGAVDMTLVLSRPEKYKVMVHAEEALIANAARKGVSLEGATLYVTGHPCENCLNQIINAGFKSIIYGPQNSQCVNSETTQYAEQTLQNRMRPGDIQLRQFRDDGTVLALASRSYDRIQKLFVSNKGCDQGITKQTP